VTDATASRRITLERARQLAVQGALLANPRPASLVEVVERLGSLQMDPTASVARAEQLVLWSRLGPYDASELSRLLFEERSLFEYWAFIVPTADYGIHRETMRRYPRGEGARARYTREWLRSNAGFRRYLLRELRRRGPLRSRELEDRAAVPWRTGGWNDGKNLSRMLELLASRGDIAIAGRQGNERIWDLAERVLPVTEPRLPAREIARRILETQLRWCGIARTDRFGFAFDGPPPGRDGALRELLREELAMPATVEGLAGEWLVHAELLEQDFRPRTTLLSPFDKLIKDRDFTEEVFGFRYRLEMYVPRGKRQFGYFVLPILHGDRLVGRIDPLFERKTGLLRINSLHWEPDAPRDVPLEETVRELADFLGAEEVVWGEPPGHCRSAGEPPGSPRPPPPVRSADERSALPPHPLHRSAPQTSASR